MNVEFGVPVFVSFVADALKERGIPFLDAAGNAYIKQANLLIWIKGQKPAAKATVITAGRAFQPTGLQVIFTLLCNPQTVNLPYRELAKMASVAHGTVGWAKAGSVRAKAGSVLTFQHLFVLGEERHHRIAMTRNPNWL